jgi:hypothetical protein
MISLLSLANAYDLLWKLRKNLMNLQLSFPCPKKNLSRKNSGFTSNPQLRTKVESAVLFVESLTGKSCHGR